MPPELELESHDIWAYRNLGLAACLHDSGSCKISHFCIRSLTSLCIPSHRSLVHTYHKTLTKQDEAYSYIPPLPKRSPRPRAGQQQRHRHFLHNIRLLALRPTRRPLHRNPKHRNRLPPKRHLAPSPLRTRAVSLPRLLLRRMARVP